MYGIFIIINNYFHDLATAVLGLSILLVYFWGRQLDKHPLKDDIISPVFKKMSKVTYGALIWVLLGGVIRALNFMEYEYNPAVEHGLVTALVVKHILLFTLTIFGIIVHRRYIKRYGQ